MKFLKLYKLIMESVTDEIGLCDVGINSHKLGRVKVGNKLIYLTKYTDYKGRWQIPVVNATASIVTVTDVNENGITVEFNGGKTQTFTKKEADKCLFKASELVPQYNSNSNGGGSTFGITSFYEGPSLDELKAIANTEEFVQKGRAALAKVGDGTVEPTEKDVDRIFDIIMKYLKPIDKIKNNQVEITNSSFPHSAEGSLVYNILNYNLSSDYKRPKTVTYIRSLFSDNGGFRIPIYIKSIFNRFPIDIAATKMAKLINDPIKLKRRIAAIPLAKEKFLEYLKSNGIALTKAEIYETVKELPQYKRIKDYFMGFFKQPSRRLAVENKLSIKDTSDYYNLPIIEIDSICDKITKVFQEKLNKLTKQLQ